MRAETVAASVHSTAVIDDDATIGAGVTIGPYVVVGPGVEIGARAHIGPHVVIERDTRVGADCRVFPGAVLGGDPQDLKYVGERTWLEIGPGTVIRECVTLNRGTAAAGNTVIGTECLIMAYSHVAHDCHIGDHVVLSNATNMGGHVEIGDWAIVGGMTAIHQFVRIGAHAMVGGASRIASDVTPYTLVSGNPATLFGINRVGLERRGFREETMAELSSACRKIFRSEVPMLDAAAEILDEGSAEVRIMAEFVMSSTRGVTKPSRRGRRAEENPGASPDHQ